MAGEDHPLPRQGLGRKKRVNSGPPSVAEMQGQKIIPGDLAASGQCVPFSPTRSMMVTSGGARKRIGGPQVAVPGLR